jgi:hypothetical protein
MAHDPTSLLIIRVWVEEGSQKPLRAFVRHTSDVSAGFEHAETLTDAVAGRAVRPVNAARFEACALGAAAPVTHHRPG